MGFPSPKALPTLSWKRRSAPAPIVCAIGWQVASIDGSVAIFWLRSASAFPGPSR